MKTFKNDYQLLKRIVSLQFQVDVLREVLIDYPTSTIESAIKQIQSRLDYYKPQLGMMPHCAHCGKALPLGELSLVGGDVYCNKCFEQLKKD